MVEILVSSVIFGSDDDGVSVDDDDTGKLLVDNDVVDDDSDW